MNSQLDPHGRLIALFRLLRFAPKKLALEWCSICRFLLTLDVVEGRRRWKCCKCHFMRYEQRQTGGDAKWVVDDIADEVALRGFSDSLMGRVLSSGFKNSSARTYQERLAKWSNLHGFQWSIFRAPDARGKERKWIRFERDKKIIPFPFQGD